MLKEREYRLWVRFDEGRLGDKVTTVEMSRGTNLSIVGRSTAHSGTQGILCTIKCGNNIKGRYGRICAILVCVIIKMLRQIY